MKNTSLLFNIILFTIFISLPNLGHSGFADEETIREINLLKNRVLLENQKEGLRSGPTEFIEGEYLVKLKDSALKSLFSNDSVFSEFSAEQLDFTPGAKIMKITFDSKTHEVEALVELMNDPQVEYVTQNFKLQRLAPLASKADLKEQWSLANVNAERAWELAGNKGSRDVVVAVIDTGVDYNHESLKANMVTGYDFAQNDDDPMDTTSQQNPGHGTHCAGIVGATGDVDGGVSGLSPVVSLMPLRFLDESGRGDLNNAVKSIDYAIENKADIISASWGAAVTKDQAAALVEGLERASQAGIPFIAAAGNSNDDNDETAMYPANGFFQNSITVVASTVENTKPDWSSFGQQKTHVAAPGLDIMSTLPNNGYKNLSGTSMATPLVSGLAALLMAQDETLTGNQLRSLMQISGRKAEIETACNCIIDAGDAMELLLAGTPYVAPHQASVNPAQELQFEVGGKVDGEVKFSSSDEAVATISEDGLLKGVAVGSVTITAEDAAGNKVSSGDIFVHEDSNSSSCPLGDEMLCQILCGIDPSMPWCEQSQAVLPSWKKVAQN